MIRGMIPAFTVGEIRQAEKQALDRTAEHELMRTAAAEVALSVADHFDGAVTGRSAVLLVGAGNNGGDALFAGALLRRRGVAVTAVLAAPERAHRAGLAALRRMRGRVVDIAAAAPVLARADVVVDGLVGIGARLPLDGSLAALVALANSATALRVAVDVPSGLDPDTGRRAGEVFHADLTVTFGGMKIGLLLADDVAGRVIVADLGMAPDPAGAGVRVLTDLDAAALLPDPAQADDKYTAGVPGIVAGSAIYPGAALLCAGGAVRLRPGMVRYAGPQVEAVVSRYPEIVGSDDPARAGTVQTWGAGPGMGTDAAALNRLSTVAAAGVPVVVDADGLTLLGQNPRLLTGRRGRVTVLTPHDREFTRLFPHLSLDDRLAAARAAAAESGAVVLLKGHRTLVASPGGSAYVNTTGSSWLATAGSGDVLTGMLASLLATGIDAALAAAGAAHLHGRAGERARRDRAPGAAALLSRLHGH